MNYLVTDNKRNKRQMEEDLNQMKKNPVLKWKGEKEQR